MRRYVYIFLLLCIAMFLLLNSCTPGGRDSAEVSRAIAVMRPVQGYSADGVIHFVQREEGIVVQGRIRGLRPGKHGFHIHSYGDITNPDASSIGGHFNPHDNPHGSPAAEERHVGDLGNIVANQAGTANVYKVDGRISFSGVESIIGRSVAVHANEDDFISQPAGNSGPKVAVGVIGIDNK